MNTTSASPADAPRRILVWDAPVRVFHWLRALVVIGTLSVGLLMVNLPDELPAKFELLYPNHKQFGLLALLLGLVQLVLRTRARHRLPAPPAVHVRPPRVLCAVDHRAADGLFDVQYLHAERRRAVLLLRDVA